MENAKAKEKRKGEGGPRIVWAKNTKMMALRRVIRKRSRRNWKYIYRG